MDVVDIASRIALSQSVSHKAFTKLRKSLNGDGTIKYRVHPDEKEIVKISNTAIDKLRNMMDASADDNFERPFFVIFDEDRLTAIDVVVGDAGDEGYCEHTEAFANYAFGKCDELQQAQRTDEDDRQPHLMISRGHTHPVFENIQRVHMGATVTGGNVEFGALPSNIFGDVATWQKRAESASEHRRRAIHEIIRKKAYKYFCEDYVESYWASHYAGFNGGGEHAKASRFHWIITPRLHQIGIFEVPGDEYGVVVYHRWELIMEST
jgi:hypothetical protein